MKYLYYPSNPIENCISIKLKKKNEDKIEERDDMDIKSLFQLKKSGKYEIITIETPNLYYKECPSAKKRIYLHGEINLLEYENGGYIPTLRTIQKIKNYI